MPGDPQATEGLSRGTGHSRAGRARHLQLVAQISVCATVDDVEQISSDKSEPGVPPGEASAPREMLS
jgi:hypothetical protein